MMCSRGTLPQCFTAHVPRSHGGTTSFQLNCLHAQYFTIHGKTNINIGCPNRKPIFWFSAAEILKALWKLKVFMQTDKLCLDSSRTDVCNCLKELEKYSRFLQGTNYFACSIAFQALQHNLLDLHRLTLFHLVSYDVHNRINFSLW